MWNTVAIPERENWFTAYGDNHCQRVLFCCISIYSPVLEIVHGLSGGYVSHDAVSSVLYSSYAAFKPNKYGECIHAML